MKRVYDIDESTLSNILKKIISRLDEWLMISDAFGKVIYANDIVYKSSGIKKGELLGEDLCMFVGIDLTDEMMLNKIQKIVQQGKQINFISNRFNKNEERIYLANTIRTIWVEGMMYYICISKDITSTTKLKKEIYQINYFDRLTRLPSKKIFLQTLEQSVKRTKRNKEKLTVTLIDIKRIGEINNLYGMCVGDYIIKEISQRIKNCLGTNEELFRYNNNVFAVIHNNLSQTQVISNFLEKMQQIVEEPVQIHDIYISVDYRCGGITYPDEVATASGLVAMAQIALTKSKKQKHNKPYVFYNSLIKTEAEITLQTEIEMHEAIANDEFIVYYQPFVALDSKDIVGMEALVRRRKKSGELMSPGTFIDTLERLNLIGKVSIRVLEKVCAQLRCWLDYGYNIVPVSVNLSAVQFKNPNLAQQIKDVLRKYNIPPKYIVLEITESAVMEDVIAAQMTIDDLKAEGFAISIDDFGTGYASIGYLKKFTFDHLKIDISFIKEITDNVQDRSIVEAIISIAKTLNLKTIAEGIESKEQMDIMSALGCEMGQGFLWDTPISAPEIESKYLKICQ